MTPHAAGRPAQLYLDACDEAHVDGARLNDVISYVLQNSDRLVILTTSRNPIVGIDKAVPMVRAAQGARACVRAGGRAC